MDKIETKLKKQEFFRRSEEYGYISKDTAAIEVAGVDSADNTTAVGIYEYLSHDFRQAEQETQSENIQQGAQEPQEQQSSFPPLNSQRQG